MGFSSRKTRSLLATAMLSSVTSTHDFNNLYGLVPILKEEAAWRSSIAVFHQIGPSLKALQVLPELKELFSQLAFS
ncbi:hypothetical protein AgCh_017547 [Apium graveolens]